MYDEIGSMVKMAQLVALVEVAHAVFRFTSSRPLITGIQLLSRNFIACGLLGGLNHSLIEKEVLILLMCQWLLTWTMADLCRYLFYTMTLIKRCPGFLEWLRYSLFVVLYPVGVLSELNVIGRSFYLVLKTKEGEQWCRSVSYQLPNSLNISLDASFILPLVFGIYALLFPTMYGHMLSQRSRKLSKKKNL
ncbi:hypothetical protein ACOME3_002644 [Neoechinorhynchus agilis]